MTDATLTVRFAPRRPGRDRWHALAAAGVLIGFGLNFWAWTLLVPLEPDLQNRFGLRPSTQGLLLAVPLVVGAFGRLPVGLLTDRYGPRITFPAVTLCTAVAVATLAADDSLAAVSASGALLGVAGTAFAAGAPLVDRLSGPDRRGMAFGLIGVGFVGAAAGAVTPQLARNTAGHRACLLVLAGVLTGYAVLAAVLVRSPRTADPGRAGRGTLGEVREVLAVAATRRTAVLYAIAFGGLTALVLYLPSYLRLQYHLSWHAALWLTAAAVFCAAVAHVVGGWLADRTGQARVLVVCYGAAAALGLVQAFQPPLDPVGVPAILGVGACLGAASGALTGQVARDCPPHRIGAVIGAIGAAGGLGALLPPMLLSGVHDLDGSYAIGLTLLAGVNLGAALYARNGSRPARPVEPRPRARPAVVAVAAIDATPDEEENVLTTLAVVAATDDVVVVYGRTSDEAHQLTPHGLIEGLRNCLPRRTVCGVLHEPDHEADVEYNIVADLVHDNAVVVVASPYAQPHRHAAEYARRLRTDRTLSLAYDRVDGCTTLR